MSEWQTIDSAPKTQGVLGFWKLPDGRGHIDRVWWDAEFEQDGWDEEYDAPAYRGAWTAGHVASWGYEEYAEAHPTHWMPLPSPPTP